MFFSLIKFMELRETLGILREKLDELSLKEHCYGIQTYGSSTKACKTNFIPKWSDVELIVVSNYDFCCPMEYYLGLQSWYKNVREEMERRGVKWGIEDEINFSIHDKGAIKSGTYSWMTEGFKEHIRKSSEVFEGKDIREILSAKEPSTKEAALVYSLWRTRLTVAESEYLKNHDVNDFKLSFKKSTKALKNFYRESVQRVEKLRSDDNRDITCQFKEIIPEIDQEGVTALQKVADRWPSEHETMKLEEMSDLLLRGLKIREITVKALASQKK